MPRVGELRANLVRAAGRQLAFHEGKAIFPRERAVMRHGALRAGRFLMKNGHAAARGVLQNAAVQRAVRRAHRAVHGGKVQLCKLVRANLRVQDVHGLFRFRADHQPAGKAVDPVHEHRLKAVRAAKALLIQVGAHMGK